MLSDTEDRLGEISKRRPKERGNYKSGCLRFDCIWKDKRCDECVRFSEYDDGGMEK